MNNEAQLKAINELVTASTKHGLEVECIWSLVHEVASTAIGSGKINGGDIVKACEHAMREWDI